jgi:hypothetical protein
MMIPFHQIGLPNLDWFYRTPPRGDRFFDEAPGFRLTSLWRRVTAVRRPASTPTLTAYECEQL